MFIEIFIILIDLDLKDQHNRFQDLILNLNSKLFNKFKCTNIK